MCEHFNYYYYAFFTSSANTCSKYAARQDPMGLPRAAASFPYRCMSCLQAKPAIEMALYDQDRVSGTNTDEAKQDEDLLTLGGEGGHGAADCLLELLLLGTCCYPCS